MPQKNDIENNLEGHQDMGGKHGGQAGVPKPPSRPRTSGREEDVILPDRQANPKWPDADAKRR